MKTPGCGHLTFRGDCQPCCTAHETRLAALAQLAVFAFHGVNPGDVFPVAAPPTVDEDAKREWEAAMADPSSDTRAVFALAGIDHERDGQAPEYVPAPREGHTVNGELPHEPTPQTPEDIAARAFRRAATRIS